MNLFFKIIIPLLDKIIIPLDLSSACGFVGAYTSDPDKPYYTNSIFLAYDNNIHNKYTIDRSRRFNTSKNIRHIYIKRINGKAILIYEFVLNNESKQLVNTGNICLSSSQQKSFLQFWSLFDTDCDLILSPKCFTLEHKFPMEAEDYYNTDWLIPNGLTIYKQGDELL